MNALGGIETVTFRPGTFHAGLCVRRPRIIAVGTVQVRGGRRARAVVWGAAGDGFGHGEESLVSVVVAGQEARSYSAAVEVMVVT